MKRTLMTYGFSLITATVIVACAATPTTTNRGDGSVKLLSARDAAEQAFLYHQQAQALWTEARGLQAQGVLRQMRGEGGASELQQRAKELARVAEAAEATAEEYRQQVLHIQMY